MEQFLTITRALSDETRVRALLALRESELCLCQIIEFLGLSPSTVSKHMDILLHAGLVQRRKDGRWVYFRLAGRESSLSVRRILSWTLQSLNAEVKIKKDSKRICNVRKKDLEELCACYKGK